jgi:hypothetical protein
MLEEFLLSVLSSQLIGSRYLTREILSHHAKKFLFSPQRCKVFSSTVFGGQLSHFVGLTFCVKCCMQAFMNMNSINKTRTPAQKCRVLDVRTFLLSDLKVLRFPRERLEIEHETHLAKVDGQVDLVELHATRQRRRLPPLLGSINRVLDRMGVGRTVVTLLR